MYTIWKSITWQQLGASLDMLENAIGACPPSAWGERTEPSAFWYIAYHVLFFHDYYLSESDTEFAPPSPFTLSELDPAGVMPDRVYSKEEILNYLHHGRDKARRRIQGLTEGAALSDSGFARRDMCTAELVLYNMRHIQHHAAQLYLLLRQNTDSAPNWVSKAQIGLEGV